MATQLGEKTAKDFGFSQFPIIPKNIACQKGIEVFAKPSDVKGISGALILAGTKASLIYSTEYNNSGFENFSQAHELGHYFLPGHAEEIIAAGGTHLSRADFTQNSSIELEADHFASGLLMPSSLTENLLGESQVGLEGVLALADKANSSATAAAIRAAQCSPYPIAVIVSQNNAIAYAFFSEGFKGLDKLPFIRKGTPLPASMTREFNSKIDRVLAAEKACAETNLKDWFGGQKSVVLDEETLGLGAYGYTLTILSSDLLHQDPDEDENEDEKLERSWEPKFAYRR
jgi:Zn-dependent peptidase ImmA (M78 family)